MAITRPKDLRKMSGKDLDKQLADLKLEMAKERANISIGATTTSPGKIKELRRSIARIHTIRKEHQ